MRKEKYISNKYILSILLTIFFLLAGLNIYARTYTSPQIPDTTKHAIPINQKPRIRFTMPNDNNIDASNKKKITNLNKPITLKDTLINDSNKLKLRKIFNPSPIKATWLAMVFPGGGQIYNRKFWKLPILYGALAGCAYALSWNNKMYNDYAQAYRDLMDDNPNTNSYKNILPSGYNYSTSQLSTLLKNRKDLYRRYRDLSVFSIIGVYLLSIVDAYVDAELSNFDITPDLSMHVEPVLMNNNFSNASNNKSVGLQCSLRF